MGSLETFLSVLDAKGQGDFRELPTCVWVSPVCLTPDRCPVPPWPHGSRPPPPGSCRLGQELALPWRGAVSGWRPLTEEVHHHRLLPVPPVVDAEDDRAVGTRLLREDRVVASICESGGWLGGRGCRVLHQAGTGPWEPSCPFTAIDNLVPMTSQAPGRGRAGCRLPALPGHPCRLTPPARCREGPRGAAARGSLL